MSFDLETLRDAVTEHGRVVRVVIAEVTGSVPREPGAAMLVWDNSQGGTIGGGALEYEAAKRARALTTDRIDRVPLGPGLGQCCGGAVVLVSEIFDAGRIAKVTESYYLRHVAGETDQPLALQRRIAAARNGHQPIRLTWNDGWLLEPVTPVRDTLWIFGAGHVGRALISVIEPLGLYDLTWIDTSEDRFPATMPTGVTQLVGANPADLVRYAHADAHHLILTYSHALDLELCHSLLRHGFQTAGLIGSRTKWARFRNRLRQLDHTDAQVSRIQCPIGQPELGKHPQAIAVGVAAELLSRMARTEAKRDRVG